MENQEFNKKLRSINKQYRALFGYIPCITDYACTREKYIELLEISIKTGHELKEYLPQYMNPQVKKAEI